VSFLDWLVEEGYRRDNRARQTRRPKTRKADVHRLTLDEACRFLEAAHTPRERRIAFLGICAGLRRNELRLLRGGHLRREWWIWFSSDIAKGGRERWIPIVGDLEAVVAEIRRNVGLESTSFPLSSSPTPREPPSQWTAPTEPGDAKTIWRPVKRIPKRAGLSDQVTAHKCATPSRTI
jgi:integrase